MDADRFDSLLRAFSRTPSRRHALRVLAGTALGGLLGIEQLKTKAKKGKGGGKGGKKKCKNKGKITICHKGQTISVSGCAWKAHQKHGDTMGACPGQDPPPECATTDDCSDLTESCQGR